MHYYKLLINGKKIWGKYKEDGGFKKGKKLLERKSKKEMERIMYKERKRYYEIIGINRIYKKYKYWRDKFWENND